MPHTLGVTTTGTGSGTTCVLSLVGTTAGRGIVVAVDWIAASSTIVSITCSGEENLTIHGTPTRRASQSYSLQLASLAKIVTGGTKTITITLSASVSAGNVSAVAQEFAGGDTTSWFDAVANANQGAATNHTVNVVSANPNALVFVAAQVEVGKTPVDGSGYTGVSFADANHPSLAEYKLDAGAAAGTQTGNFTTSATSDSAIVAATFNAPYTHQEVVQQVNAGGSGTSLSIVLPGVVAGNGIIVGLAYRNGSSNVTISSITCTPSESNLTLHGSTYNAGTTHTVQHASLPVVTASGTKTLTITFASTVSAQGYALEVSGGNKLSWFDNKVGATGVSISPNVGITTANDKSLVVAIMQRNPVGNPLVAGNGYTPVPIVDIDLENQGEYDLDAGVAGAKTADFVLQSSSTWTIQAAAFNCAVPTNDGSVTVTTFGVDAATNDASIIITTFLVQASGPDFGSVDITTFSVQAAGPDYGSVDLSAFGVDSTGTSGGLGSGSVDIVFNIDGTIVVGHYALLDLDTFSVDGVMAEQITGVVDLQFAFDVDVVVLPGHVGDGDITLSTLSVLAYGAPVSDINLEFTVSGTLATGQISSGAVTLLGFTTDGVEDNPNIGNGSVDLVFTVSGSVLSENLGAVSLTLTSFNVDATGSTGSVGNASVSIVFTVSATGYDSIDYAGVIDISVFTVDGLLATDLSDSSFRVLALNTLVGGDSVTEFQQFDFNSFALFNGKYYGVGSGGLVELTGLLDGVEPINARVLLGITDFNSETQLYAPYIYLTMRVDGDLEILTRTNESIERVNDCTWDGEVGIREKRVRLDPGVKDREWQFGFQNVDGADFEVVALRPLPMPTERRIR